MSRGLRTRQIIFSALKGIESRFTSGQLVIVIQTRFSSLTWACPACPIIASKNVLSITWSEPTKTPVICSMKRRRNVQPLLLYDWKATLLPVRSNFPSRKPTSLGLNLASWCKSLLRSFVLSCWKFWTEVFGPGISRHFLSSSQVGNFNSRRSEHKSKSVIFFLVFWLEFCTENLWISRSAMT